MNKNYTIPALCKTITLLEYLGKSESGGSQAELARVLGIPNSTCYRILQSLLAYNWIRQKPGSLYVVANGILAAAGKLINETADFECLQPVLEQLAKASGLSCKLSIRQEDMQTTIMRAESSAPITVTGKVGVHFPITEGATGAALLYDESSENILQLVATCRENIEEKKYPNLIDERLLNLKENGYCMNSHLNRWGIEAMAAPLLDSTGHIIAAITVMGFTSDFTSKNIEIIVANLRKAIKECTNILKLR